MFHRDYWEHNEANNIAFLDSLEDDFLDRMIQEGADIHDIAENLYDMLSWSYNGKYPDPNDIFLDWLSDDELADYLTDRFGYRFEEVTNTILASKKKGVD